MMEYRMGKLITHCGNPMVRERICGSKESKKAHIMASRDGFVYIFFAKRKAG